jgi:hypothetical protein
LSGTYSGAVTLNNAANNFTGNGAGLTALNASELASGIVPDDRLPGDLARTGQVWLLGGNAGTAPGAQFIGTTDGQPLEFKVNGMRALRIEDNGDGSDSGDTPDGAPNVIGGSPVNSVTPGVVGATISGGGTTNFGGFAYTNRVMADFGTVGGGRQNTASGINSTVGGGSFNTASNSSSTVGGGIFNRASDFYSTVGGGNQNTASDFYSTVGGGNVNTARGANSTVPGGIVNTASGNSSTVGGGNANTASGAYSTVPGGTANIAAGDYSFAAGLRAQASHQGAFVWGDSQNVSFASTAENQFSIRASGGVRFSDDTPALSFGSDARQMINLFGTQYAICLHSSTTYFRSTTRFTWFAGGVHSDTQNAPGAGGSVMMTLTSGGLTVNGTFVRASDRNAKENIVAVDPRAVLEQVAALPIARWNYKHDQETPHLGPMAQDFYAAFGVGPDDKHIATVDADGVALAAIQGLNQKLTDELKQKGTEITELKQRLEKLERLMNQQNEGAK